VLPTIWKLTGHPAELAAEEMQCGDVDVNKTQPETHKAQYVEGLTID
jgi:hypothetical protein